MGAAVVECINRKSKHVTNPKVSILRATTLEATANEPVFIDMDDEFVSKLPINISILPVIHKMKQQKSEKYRRGKK